MKDWRLWKGIYVMGNRAECPSCKAYTSNVYAAINFDHRDCECGCPYQVLVKWNDLKPELEKMETSKCEKELLNMVKDQKMELAALKSKLKKLEDIFCWREVLEPLIRAQKILQNDP